MKKWLILPFAGLLVLGACKNPTDKKLNTEKVLEQAGKLPGVNAGAGNFDVDVPTGWTRIDTSMSGVKMTFILSQDISGNFRANADVLTQSMNGVPADKFFNENVDVMSKGMAQFSALGKGEKEIGGIHSYWLHYSDFNNGRMLDQTLYVIPSGGIAYFITFTDLKERLAKDQPGFDQILSSFKVH